MSTTTVPIVKTDGSVQVVTIIRDNNAPQRFTYELTVPDGGRMTEDAETGLVSVVDADGAMISAVAAPWAVDANGNPVATHFELEGDVLTQVIDHGEGDAYPIIADPYLGWNLFSRMTTSTYQGQPRYHLHRSVWGAAQAANLNGWAVFRYFGWTEASTRWPALKSKLTLKHQYMCHADWALLKPDSWNLEKSRRNNPYYWIASCNW